MEFFNSLDVEVMRFLSGSVEEIFNAALVFLISIFTFVRGTFALIEWWLQRSPSPIEKPPGHWITSCLCFLSRSRFERHFGQAIADARAEHAEALARGDEKEAKKIARELNYDLIALIFVWLAGWPAAVLQSIWGIVSKKDE